MRHNAWGPVLFAGAFAVQYYVVSAYGAQPNDGFFIAAGWIAVGLLALGLVAFRPRPLAAWVAVLAASTLYLVGDAVLASLTSDSPIVSFPSAADWIYLAMYPVLAVALLALARRGGDDARRPDRARLLDVGVVALVAAGTVGALYGTAAATDEFLTGTAQWVAIAYPLFDVLLLAVALWVALPPSSGERSSGAAVLLAGGVVAMVVGNTVYNHDLADFVASQNGVAEAGWLTFTVLLTVAGLRPDADRVIANSLAPTGRAAALRLRSGVVLAAAITGPLAVVIWADGADLRFTWAVFAVAAVGLVARSLVGARSADPAEDVGVRSQPSVAPASASASL